jgi:hypothetical protein
MYNKRFYLADGYTHCFLKTKSIIIPMGNLGNNLAILTQKTAKPHVRNLFSSVQFRQILHLMIEEDLSTANGDFCISKTKQVWPERFYNVNLGIYKVYFGVNMVKL